MEIKAFPGIKFHTLLEAAELIGVTPTTMRSYVANGAIAGRKVGGKWLVTDEVIKEHILGKISSLPQSANQNDQITKPASDKESKPEVQKEKICEIEIKLIISIYGS